MAILHFWYLNMEITKPPEVSDELMEIVADSYFCSVEQFERTLRPATQLFLFSSYISILTNRNYPAQWETAVRNFIRKNAGIYSSAKIVDLEGEGLRLECFNLRGEGRDGVFISVGQTSVTHGKIDGVGD